MNHNATAPATIPQLSPAFRDNYYNSTVDLHRGTSVCEVSLGHLTNEELVELLRMRVLWNKH